MVKRGGVSMRKTITFISGLILISNFCFAETIALKSGKTIEGEIIEQTEEYIKIDFHGVPLTYYMEDIENASGLVSQAPYDFERLRASFEGAYNESSEESSRLTPGVKDDSRFSYSSSGKDATQGSNWYAGVKGYLIKIEKIVEAAGKIQQKTAILGQQAKQKGDAQSVQRELNHAKDQVISYIDQLSIMKPPAELKGYHMSIMQMLENNKAIITAGLGGRAAEAMSHTNNTVNLLMESLKKLKAVYIQYNAPQEEIVKTGNTIKLLQVILGPVIPLI